MPDRKSQAFADDEDRALPLARLVIEQPRLSDEALYKCDVTYVKGKCPSISLVKVQMMSLPGKAQIRLLTGKSGSSSFEPTVNDPPLNEGQLLGPLNEHEQLRLTCQVLGGRPQPKSIIWRKIDPLGQTINLLHEQTKLIMRDLNHQQQPLVEVQLNHTLISSDLGAKFECHVEHEALERPLSRQIGAGSEQSLSMAASQEDSMLDLHPSKLIDTGANTMGSRQSLDSYIYLDLNVGVSSVDLFMSKTSKKNSSDPLREGDLVELECVAYGSKPPANITWFNGADTIDELVTDQSSVTNSRLRHKRLLQRNQVIRNSDGQTFDSHSFLSIRLSRYENKAQISCKAQNPSMPQPMIKSLELQVEHAPIVLMEPAGGIIVNEQLVKSARENARTTLTKLAPSGEITNALGDIEQQRVSIYCIYSANPAELIPNSTRWYRNGQPLAISSNDTDRKQHHWTESLTATGYPVLNLNQVTRHDAGRYDCQVANAIGFSERLPEGEACKVEVNFRPSVRLRTYKPSLALSSSSTSRTSYSMEELLETDLSEELILAGNTYVMICEVTEARPSKIDKYHWFKRALPRETIKVDQLQQQSRQAQLIAATETGQFVLNSLASNFSPASYHCSAFNSLGPSDNSNQAEFRLSYSPGPSVVRPVRDATLLRHILGSGDLAQSSSVINIHSDNIDPHGAQPAGQKIILECSTLDAGQPRANIWLWFKNGQPIVSSRNGQTIYHKTSSTSSGGESNNIKEFDDDNNNPIVGDLRDSSSDTTQQLLATSIRKNRNNINKKDEETAIDTSSRENQESSPMKETNLNEEQIADSSSFMKMKLLDSGRYLFIPSIQLAHKGNYSCVAVNRFGSGPQQSSDHEMERDSYQLKVAVAPSFIQPLPSRTHWSEISPSSVLQSNDKPLNDGPTDLMELVCHVQCDPLCHIEWLRNGQAIDSKGQSYAGNPYHPTYKIKQSILDENLEANLFKSIESRLVIRLQNATSDREAVLARRSYLNASNYTCQSTPNTMGPPVRSTTRFVVQYPPENVLINAPSDKLNFVEGSNGPRLSCEASSEPQVQYRWFLSKGSSTDLASSKYNLRPFSSKVSTLQSPNGLGNNVDDNQQDYIINQMTNGRGPTADLRGANDLFAGNFLSKESLIELTGSISEQRGGSPITTEATTSILDLSNLSLDRKQTGHYICEASNKLGHSKQTVYVNVLYKPTCSSLHLHSLDALVAPSETDSLKQSNVKDNLIKPFRASQNDQYSMIRETSEDFINLRRTLVLAPLLNGHQTATGDFESDDLSFKNSIFKKILDDKSNSEKSMMKDKDSLIHQDLADLANDNNILSMSRDELNRVPNRLEASGSGDAWNRLNHVLLNFINSYINQVRNDHTTSTESSLRDIKRGKRQDYKDSSRSTIDNHLKSASEVGETRSSRNLLTFACMAQDGNPMNNLSFGWSFNSMNLPETGNYIELDPGRLILDRQDSDSSPLEPIMIYENVNATVSVFLVRRLDTKYSLNPFQMSLLTLDVVVNNFKNNEGPISVSRRQASPSDSPMSQSSQKVPVIRNRIQSPSSSQRSELSNVQFANEFEASSSGSSYSTELDENNWQEQLGNLLKCQVTNQIGTSDVCHVRINLAERLKSSNSEFAKWRMPSLAQKSLLIVSILVGCALIVFTISALLAGRYLRGLSYKSSESVHESRENNTAQSTSSQKSSVLGLLTNGDSSFQGSSDDDSNGRSNHNEDNGPHSQSQALDLGGSSLSGVVSNGYLAGHDHYQMGQTIRANAVANYDKPRRLQDSNASYQNGIYREKIPEQFSVGTADPTHYLDRLVLTCDNDSLGNLELQRNSSKTSNHSSTGSKLLANIKLKSLSRFKVDRISDRSSLASRLKGYHSTNISSSGTDTTGLSNLCLDNNRNLTLTNTTRLNSKHVGPVAFRHSYTSARRQMNLPDGPLYQLHRDGTRPLQESPMYDTNNQRMMGSQSSQVVPTYSNLQNFSYNAMDEFITRKELESSLEYENSIGYARQSNQMSKNQRDLTTLYSPQICNPPNQHLTPRLMTSRQTKSAVGPPVAARPHRRPANVDPDSLTYQLPVSNRYSTPPQGEFFMINSTPVLANTIDNHLDRLMNNSKYSISSQMVPTSSSLEMRQVAQNIYGNSSHRLERQTSEHIYDVNAYATPEHILVARALESVNQTQDQADRPRVSQLIETFNSKLPE